MSLFFTEKFRDIDLSSEKYYVRNDLKNLYKVSNCGNVKSVKTNKILKPYKNNNGYSCVKLIGYTGREYRVPIHYLVADAFLENSDREFYTVINHKDECKTNADVRNLEWCTQKYNLHYSMHKKCKLSEDEIYSIYMCDVIRNSKILVKKYECMTNEDICKQYNISQSTLNKILTAKGYYGWVIYKKMCQMGEYLYNLGVMGDEVINGEVISQSYDDVKRKQHAVSCGIPADYLDEKLPYKEKK